MKTYCPSCKAEVVDGACKSCPWRLTGSFVVGKLKSEAEKEVKDRFCCNCEKWIDFRVNHYWCRECNGSRCRDCQTRGHITCKRKKDQKVEERLGNCPFCGDDTYCKDTEGNYLCPSEQCQAKHQQEKAKRPTLVIGKEIVKQDEIRKARKEGFSCAWSLAKAIQDAGGSLDNYEKWAKMTLEDFISEVATQNGIRFVFVSKEGNK